MGGDDVHPNEMQVRYSSCPATDLPNQLSESAARVSSPNPKAVLIFQAKCLGQSSEPTSRVRGRTAGSSRPSSLTLTSQALAQISRLSHLSESGAQGTCPCQPSESTAQASRPSPLPESPDQVDFLIRPVESTAQVCRQISCRMLSSEQAVLLSR
jgi:hypothetical protein